VKIAQVLTASVGGIGRHVASIAPRMLARGHEVRVFCPRLTAEAQGFEELGLEVHPLSRLDRAGGADVLHAHGYKAGGLALPVTVVTRTPLVVTWHNAVLGSGRSATVARLLQRLVAHGATLTLGASSDLVAEAQRLGARSARLAPVAPPPVLAADPRDRTWTRAELGVGAGDTLVLTVARLAPQKNLGLVLDIASGVRDRADLRFVIVGEGPERPALERRIADDDLAVRLLGHRDALGPLLAAADVALLTSTWEARALVAQEALLAGLPLVSTRVGGITELVGDAALLFDLGDAAAAAQALRRLADDTQERERLREAGRRRAATWPDEDAVVDDLLATYAALLDRA
jgi:glycosyltransferase involved in cell wall biosynthesis